MLPATDMYPRITKLIFDDWQEVWNSALEINYMLLDVLQVGGYKQKTSIVP